MEVVVMVGLGASKIVLECLNVLSPTYWEK